MRTLTQRQRNARDIRNSWMSTARYYKEIGSARKRDAAVQTARAWGRELVRRMRSETAQ